MSIFVHVYIIKCVFQYNKCSLCIQGRRANKSWGHQPLPSLSLPLPSLPLPSFPFPSPSPPLPPPLEVGPLIAARGSGERFSSPSGSGRGVFSCIIIKGVVRGNFKTRQIVLSPPVPSLPLPLEVGPLIAARGSGERFSSPSGSGRGVFNCIIMKLKLKLM